MNEGYISTFVYMLYCCIDRTAREGSPGGNWMGDKKENLEVLSMRVPKGLKTRLGSKAKKYDTDMTTLTKMILSSALDQI